MIEAPASSAAEATAARVVSTLVGTPSARSAAITGTILVDLHVGVHAGSSGPGRLAADVDILGALPVKENAMRDSGRKIFVEPAV